jgi:hypothetical protein
MVTLLGDFVAVNNQENGLMQMDVDTNKQALI